MVQIKIGSDVRKDLDWICSELDMSEDRCIQNAILNYIHDMKDYTSALQEQNKSLQAAHKPILFDDLCRDLDLDD